MTYISQLKEREERQPVRLSVRFKTDHGWSDAQIRNLSSRGMLVVTPRAPKSGTYVELWRGDCVMVGRVVWSFDDRFGLRTQDVIDLDAVTRSRPQTATKTRRASDRAKLQGARRASSGEIAANSSNYSRAFQFLAVALAAGAAVAILADTAYSAISAPLERANAIVSPSGD